MSSFCLFAQIHPFHLVASSLGNQQRALVSFLPVFFHTDLGTGVSSVLGGIKHERSGPSLMLSQKNYIKEERKKKINIQH